MIRDGSMGTDREDGRFEGQSADRGSAAATDVAATGNVEAGELPVRIRPAVAVVLAIGAVISVASFILDPPPEIRYGLVGLIAVLYFLTKVRHWL
ncbi:MAG: hypothetical protein RL698_2006 [Pseudomonadota bacterium]|jgi:hypothetical protein